MLIISASNVITSRDKSQSLDLARKAKSLFGEAKIDAEIIDLRDYRIENCNMCESCSGNEICVQKDGFNDFYRKWRDHKDVLVICPHYASIPSKLIAIIEKLQEMSYLAYCSNKKIDNRKNVVIVAHGGMTEDYDDMYKTNLIIPLSNMLKGIGCQILNDSINEVLCFGVKKYYKDRDENSVCYRKDNDLVKSNAILNIAVKSSIEKVNN